MARREKRAKAMKQRAQAIARNDIAAAKRHAKTARRHADAMRKASGRERAEGTRYLGHSTPELRLEKTGTASQTDWQEYNAEILNALGGNRDYYKQTWTPELQDYWIANQSLPGGVIARPDLGTDQRDINLLTGYGLLSGNNKFSSAFQHPYAGSDYSIPDMQTGGSWEGLGAEYQPGTVEGLGLLASDYGGYSPMAKSALSATPSYMQPTGGLLGKTWQMGLSGDTTKNKTKTNTNKTGPTFGITSGSVKGGDAVWGWS
jgi:hypothetical protein